MTKDEGNEADGRFPATCQKNNEDELMSGYHKRNVDFFPVHTLKRVDRPMTKILDDQVQRVDERESGFNKAAREDYGEALRTERGRFVLKYPFSAALMQMQITLREIVVASSPRRRPRSPKIQSGEGKP